MMAKENFQLRVRSSDSVKDFLKRLYEMLAHSKTAC